MAAVNLDHMTDPLRACLLSYDMAGQIHFKIGILVINNDCFIIIRFFSNRSIKLSNVVKLT